MSISQINPDGLDERRAGWMKFLTEANRQIVRHRFWMLERWDEAIGIARANRVREAAVTVSFIRFIQSIGFKGITRSTLFNWRRAARADGIWGLIDLRWLRSRPKGSWPFVCALMRMFIEKDCRKIFIPFCHEHATELANDRGWPRLTLAESIQWIDAHIPDRMRADRASSTPV